MILMAHRKEMEKQFERELELKEKSISNLNQKIKHLEQTLENME